jgi:hypothetical protein
MLSRRVCTPGSIGNNRPACIRTIDGGAGAGHGRDALRKFPKVLSCNFADVSLQIKGIGAI